MRRRPRTATVRREGPFSEDEAPSRQDCGLGPVAELLDPGTARGGFVLAHQHSHHARGGEGIVVEGHLQQTPGVGVECGLEELLRVHLSQSLEPRHRPTVLAGVPAEVAAYAATSPIHRMETEDIVAAAMRFPDGAMGTIGATTTAYPGFPERIEIIAERGPPDRHGPPPRPCDEGATDGRAGVARSRRVARQTATGSAGTRW